MLDMESKFEANLNGETLLVKMTGEVTGQSQLPNIKDLKARKVMIDLAGLKYINSVECETGFYGWPKLKKYFLMPFFNLKISRPLLLNRLHRSKAFYRQVQQ